MRRDDLIGRSIAAQLGQRIPIDRPVLFSGVMVRALLREVDPKTQTRRLVKGTALDWLAPATGFTPEFVASDGNHLCPYGRVGDRLWVRESFFNLHAPNAWPAGLSFRADSPGLLELGGKRVVWTPSIHMPRWASRITLEVTSVRIERLQAISEDDAKAEGVAPDRESSRDAYEGHAREFRYREPYQRLWDLINGKRAPWSSDPWVWVVGFQRA